MGGRRQAASGTRPDRPPDTSRSWSFATTPCPEHHESDVARRGSDLDSRRGFLGRRDDSVAGHGQGAAIPSADRSRGLGADRTDMILKRHASTA